MLFEYLSKSAPTFEVVAKQTAIVLRKMFTADDEHDYFKIYRYESEDDATDDVNATDLEDEVRGRWYSDDDDHLVVGKTYWYRLSSVDIWTNESEKAEARQATIFARLPWDGASKFRHGPGVNMAYPLGFYRYVSTDPARPDLVWNTPDEAVASWKIYYPPIRQSHIEARVEVVRICFDPHLVLLGAASADILEGWADALRRVIDTVVDTSDGGQMKAILDLHIAAGSDADPATSDFGIMASYEGDKVLWAKYKRMCAAFMRMLNVNFTSTQVAFEIYNETERLPEDATYIAAIVEAANELHHTYGDRIKVIVAPPYYAAHPSFTAASAFRRDLFNARHIGFACHAGYYPNLFTHQGAAIGFNKYIHRLPFFPVPADAAAFIAGAVAEATADGASSGMISDMTSSLATYFVDFEEHTDYNGSFDIPTAYPITYIWGNYLGDGHGAHIYAWMLANDVTGDMMHLTEIGLHRDYQGVGASVDDAGTFLRLIKSYAIDARKMNGLIGWGEFGGHFSLREDASNGVGEYDPSGPFEKKIIRALGMHSEFTTDELGDRFVYLGSEPSAITALSASAERRGIFVKIRIGNTSTNRTILGASANGGAQFFVNSFEGLTVSLQGLTQQGGTNISVPVNKAVVVGVVMAPGAELYRYVIGRALHGGAEQYDDAGKSAFTPGTTAVIGETFDHYDPFTGQILSDFLITDGVITDDEIAGIIELLNNQ